MKLTDKFSLETREREERMRFLQLNNEDMRLLKQFLPLMERHVNEVVERYYAHLLKFAEARAFLGDEEKLETVKATQRDYLLDLFRGKIDEQYFERRLEIGMTHERIGLLPKWYIGSYSQFLQLILPLIARKLTFRPRRLIKAIMALIKIMNLDQQLAIETYLGARAEKLSHLGKEIEDATHVLAASTSEILASVTQVASGAAETATAVSETATTMEEVKHAARVSSQAAEHVSDISQKTVEVTRKGEAAVAVMVEAMRRIQEQVDIITDRTVRLSEHAEAIGEIIATVNDLSEQSNLLAVNAAIEAARAGEQGKGFAVVAQEIKNLADQSKQATAQVRAILNDIQKATDAAVMAAEQGGKAVKDGVKQSTDADQSIRILATTVSEAADAVSQISVSIKEQLVGVDQVNLAMENIKETSQQTAESMKQIEVAARHLHKLGQQSKRLMGQAERSQV